MLIAYANPDIDFLEHDSGSGYTIPVMSCSEQLIIGRPPTFARRISRYTWYHMKSISSLWPGDIVANGQGAFWLIFCGGLW